MVRFTLRETWSCPSRASASAKYEREEGKFLEKRQSENKKVEQGIGVLQLGWPWAYEKARPQTHKTENRINLIKNVISINNSS